MSIRFKSYCYIRGNFPNVFSALCAERLPKGENGNHVFSKFLFFKNSRISILSLYSLLFFCPHLFVCLLKVDAYCIKHARNILLKESQKEKISVFFFLARSNYVSRLGIFSAFNPGLHESAINQPARVQATRFLQFVPFITLLISLLLDYDKQLISENLLKCKRIHAAQKTKIEKPVS